jgi:hypothetical protein
MPFESALPLVVACLAGAVVVFFIWLRVRPRWLLAVAILLAAVGIGCFVADWLVETDREYLVALFPHLARGTRPRKKTGRTGHGWQCGRELRAAGCRGRSKKSQPGPWMAGLGEDCPPGGRACKASKPGPGMAGLA